MPLPSRSFFVILYNTIRFCDNKMYNIDDKERLAYRFPLQYEHILENKKRGNYKHNLTAYIELFHWNMLFVVNLLLFILDITHKNFLRSSPNFDAYFLTFCTTSSNKFNLKPNWNKIRKYSTKTIYAKDNNIKIIFFLYFQFQQLMKIFNYVDTAVVFVIPLTSIIILNTFTGYTVWRVAGVRRTMTTHKRWVFLCRVYQ